MGPTAMLINLYLSSIFFGDLLIGITIPAAIILLPLLILAYPPKGIPAGAVLIGVACLSVAVQTLMGRGPVEKSDLVVYLPVVYSAIVLWGLSGTKVDDEQIFRGLMVGGYMLGALMVVSIVSGFSGELDYYAIKNLASTALGQSNYLAVFFVFILNVALCRRSYFNAVMFAAFIGLTFSRAGLLVVIASLALWSLICRNVVGRGALARVSAIVICLAAVPISVHAALQSATTAPQLSAQSATTAQKLSAFSESSIRARGSKIASSFKAFKEHPFFGSPRSVLMSDFGHDFSWDPHNSVLASLALIGIWGTLFYGAYLAWGLMMIVKIARLSELWVGIAAGIVITLVWSLAEIIVFTPAYAILFATMAGLAYAQRGSRLTGAGSPIE